MATLKFNTVAGSSWEPSRSVTLTFPDTLTMPASFSSSAKLSMKASISSKLSSGQMTNSFQVTVSAGGWSTKQDSNGDDVFVAFDYSATQETYSFSVPASKAFSSKTAQSVRLAVKATDLNTGKVLATGNLTLLKANASWSPSFTLSVQQSGSPSGWGNVKNVSRYTASITGAASRGGADLKSYKITGAGKTSTGTTLSTVPTADASIKFTAVVTDSRGFSTTKTATVTQSDYAKPSISLSAARCTSAGAVDDEGTYIRVLPTFKHDATKPGNTASCTVSMRSADSGAAIESKAASSGAAVVLGSSKTGGAALMDYPYVVTATVKDKYATVTRSVTVNPAFYTIDFLEGGKGVSFGGACTSTGVHFHLQPTGHDGRGYVSVKETMDSNATPDTEVTGNAFAVKDKNGVSVGFSNTRVRTNGDVRLGIGSQKVVDGTTKSNVLWLDVKNDGTFGYSVSDKTAFRKNLGLAGMANANGADCLTNQSGSTNCWIRTPQQGIYPYSSALGTECYVGASSNPFTGMRAKQYAVYDGASHNCGGVGLYTAGTASTLGDAFVNVGNEIAEGNAGNARGRIRIYGNNTGYSILQNTQNNTEVYNNYMPRSGSLMARTTLYNSSTGTTGTVTLSESAANFAAIEVYYCKSSDATYMGRQCARAWNGYGSAALQLTIAQYNTATSGMQVLQTVAQRLVISGTSITRQHTGHGNVRSNSTITTGSEDKLTIYRVDGWR